MSEISCTHKETVVRFQEHEILLSFHNDEDAVAFEDWWFDKGEDLYKKYLEYNS